MTKAPKIKCQWIKNSYNGTGATEAIVPAYIRSSYYEDGPINFKALRARFQEEAALAQARTSRPAVAEKPRKVPHLGAHCGAQPAVESKAAPVASRVIFRDGLWPISFPPQQLQHLTSPGDGTVTRQSLRDRCAATPPAEPLPPGARKEAAPPVKIKKKGLLLPFKSAKSAKAGVKRGEPPYADLSSRPAGELSSADTHSAEDGSSAQGEQSTSEYPTSSPDAQLTPTPPQEDTSGDSDRRPSVSTLERAKKKLSCRHFLLYGSGGGGSVRSPCSADGGLSCTVPPPEGARASPLALPHLACVSARPFSKASGSIHKSPVDKRNLSHRAPACPVKHVSPPTPPKKPMPDLGSLGPRPLKPPRPPCVEQSRYSMAAIQDSLCAEALSGVCHTAGRQPHPEQTPVPNPVVEPPDFPDFENSAVDVAVGDPVDIAALELEALEMVGGPHTKLSPEAHSFDLQGLNLARHDLILLDPAAFPCPLDLCELQEPLLHQSWPPGQQVAVQASEACGSATEDHELGEQAALSNGTEKQQCMCPHDVYYDTCDNMYEDVESGNKFAGSQNSRKRKGTLKNKEDNVVLYNPYAESLPMKVDAHLNKWSRHPCKERHGPGVADYKERKKREKQRLEKEKKEQKERDKKDNDMKKKFKVTGQEEPMYHAKVTVASKVRKHDLPVRSGDTVSIIRTTSCPKGKWLARDANQKYGYISVMNVELNIQEMLELGQKAQAGGRGAAADTISTGSRSSNHPVLTSSFTDDSEEWAVEDETALPSLESHSFHQRADAKPEMLCGLAGAQHTLSVTNLEELHTQSRHAALQKLAKFFQQGRGNDLENDGEPTPTNAEQPSFLHAVEEPSYPEQEVDFMDMEFLPPPPLYADNF